VPASSTHAEVHRVLAAGGCGTIASPWTGWERQVETALHGPARTFLFAAGFWAAGRPVRLGSGVTVGAERPEDGRPWFLPGDDLETLFRVDGAREVALTGICFAGRSGLAAHALVVRCAARLEVRGCRFDDFSAADGSAILVAGESPERPVAGVVICGSTFLHGRTALHLGSDASDLLVADNRFEEFDGPAAAVDPRADAPELGLLFVKNRIRSGAPERDAPLFRIGPGASGLRLAENAFEGLETDPPPRPDAPAAIEIRGAGPGGRRRIEILLNAMTSIRGAALEARGCGPGLVACGNRVFSSGTSLKAAIDLAECRGALVEDNEIRGPRGQGLRLADCRRARARGNDLSGAADPGLPRSAGAGIRVEGPGGHRIRVSDNRVSGTRDAGIAISDGTGLRIVGNEVRDCGEGIRVGGGRALVLVGNDCRENGGCGIAVDASVRHGLVTLNHAVLNGTVDLAVRGRDVRSRGNKVERSE
jgi:hypothetical protein